MVHNAFDSVQILKDCPVKIESVGLWGARLLLGCMDGSLRIYAPEDSPNALSSDSESSVPSYTLRDTRVGFSKKAVTSMDVLQSRGLLITLSDAVAIHTLPDFEVVSYLNKTKAATLYAWDGDRGLLAVAKQKRIYAYRYDGNRDFVEIKDLTAPDVVKAMAWCTDSLCLGVRREYVIMNISTAGTVDVFPCGRITGPLIVALPQGDLLLGKDNIGVIVDHNGKLTQEGGLSWSEAPATVVIHSPYALARLSRFIEVRSLRAPHGLVQMLSLRDINLVLSTDAGLVAASDHSIYRILPVPLSVQVVQLAASGNFEDALVLCKMLPPEDSALRAAKEDAIHIRFGHYLFEQGEYVEAMEHFGASSLDLITILSLFPSINIPYLVYNHTPELSPEDHTLGSCSESSLSKLLSDQPDAASANPPTSQLAQMRKLKQKKDFQDIQQRKMAISALSAFLMSKRGAVTEKAEAEETNAAVAAMVEGTNTKQSSAAERGANIPEKNTDSDQREQHDARQLATVLDTAVVQALLATDHSLTALQLLKGSNYCNVTACRGMMLAGGHYLELLELYKSNKMHHEALQLLNCLVEKPDSFAVHPKESQFGAQNIVDYLMVKLGCMAISLHVWLHAGSLGRMVGRLSMQSCTLAWQSLGDQDPMLILESSDWVLKNNPDQALILFSSFSPPLPVNLVLAHLKDRAPELRVFYLENMLSKHKEGDSAPEDLQSELMQLYLTRVLEERAEFEAQGKWDERLHNKSREKLLKALQNSSTYSPEHMLQRLPVNGLYEERAYLLGQLGQHQLALTLYVHKLHEPELALAYCDRLYLLATTGRKCGRMNALPTTVKSTDQAAVNIYLTLLEVYLKPKVAVKEYDRSLASLAPMRSIMGPKPGPGHRSKGQVARKIAEIERAEESKYSIMDNVAESSRSDTEELTEGAVSIDGLMLDDALHLLSRRWDRFNGAQALCMIPSDTKLQNLLPFLQPLLRTSSEAYRNSAVIKSLHRNENLQVQEELLRQRKRGAKVNSEQACSICCKRIGTSVFAVYPNGTLAHFVCYRDCQPAAPRT